MVSFKDLFDTPVTADQIKSLEQTLQLTLPEDYQRFLLQHNGAVPTPDLFRYRQVYGAAKVTVSHFFGISSESQTEPESQHDLPTINAQMSNLLPKNFIAIGDGPQADFLCLDCGAGASFGKVFVWNFRIADYNAKNESSSSYDNECEVATSFSAFVSGLVAQPDINYRSETFKLHYRDTFMGTITNVFTDQPWFIGDLSVTEAYDEFREGFTFLTDEDNDERWVEPLPIDIQNWFIEDDRGNREECEIAIHDQGTEIWWRWS